MISRGANRATRLRQRWRVDAVVGNEGFGLGEIGRDAGRGDRFTFLDALGDGKIQFEKLGQQVFFGGEAVGGEDGGVQGGVGVFEWICAGQFQGAVEGTEAQSLSPHAPDHAACLGYSLHLLWSWRLGPWEGVEDGFDAVDRKST